MVQEKQLDLRELFNESLSLNLPLNSYTRKMFHRPVENFYKKLIEQDPLTTLGENGFDLPKKVPVDKIGSPIQEFFRGANVLITGGTGFIGKILTEKLIRSIPHIGHIYLLIRSKRGNDSQQRFNELMKDKVFLRMQAEVPDYRSKITVISGDLAEPDLGLCVSDRQLLWENIDVVFHSAADVRFVEPLRAAVQSNVVGSKRVLELAKRMSHLKAYVNISTAYSQCVRRVIDEVVPKMNIHYNEILKYIDSKTDEELEIETPKLLQGWPNTYTFSKAMSEEMIVQERGDMPVCIVRPSAVFPSYKEPVRGWTDNLYGPLGVLVGAGHGIIHTYNVKEDGTFDCVPVDYVANCSIAAAWNIATSRKYTGTPVYNFALSSFMLISWKRAMGVALEMKNNWPYNQAIWYTSFVSIENSTFSKMAFFVLHRVPGVFFDKLAELTGGKPRLTKLYRRLQGLNGLLAYFAFNDWEFRNENVMALWGNLNEEDKQIFDFDLRDYNLEEHLLVSKVGSRYYFLKESMDSLPAANQKNTRLFWIHNIFKLICGAAILKMSVLVARVMPF